MVHCFIITMMKLTAAAILILSTTKRSAVQSFLILETSWARTRTGPMHSSEFREPDLATDVLNIIPNVAPMEDLVQVEETEMELFQHTDDDNEFPSEQRVSVTEAEAKPVAWNEADAPTNFSSQPSQQAMMIGKLLGMDTGAFPDSPASGGEAKPIPGMRRVPLIKNYQTNKVIQSFRKVGNHYPEILKPTDLTDPKTYTP
jgi:hypothetical protein